MELFKKKGTLPAEQNLFKFHKISLF